jgi:hydrogenase maturation protein HypF
MSKIILALGADIKNRFLVAQNGAYYFGPDIGDLSQIENFELFKKEVGKVTRKFKPNIIACDLHPNYFSSRLAREVHNRPSTINYRPVQHHHAHIASVMQEYNLTGPIIGVSFDGTGYGEDGNSWGGEFLLVDRFRFKRLAHLKYRMMPGGDKVVYEPWRMVLSILGEKAFSFLKKIRKKDKMLIMAMMSKHINSPLSSSAGRLFDAAAALLGICVYASYEAEGPIKLEKLSDTSIKRHYKFSLVEKNECAIIDTDGLFLGMLKDLREGRSRRLIATKFHNSIAEIIVQMVKNLSKSLGIKDVALSGGVFQNKFLKTKVIKKLADLNFNVFTNIKLPVNDFNISWGQYYACRYLL